MNFILTIWTVVAVSLSSGSSSAYEKKYMDWRPIGVFQSKRACIEAAAQLGKQPTEYRCLPDLEK